MSSNVDLTNPKPLKLQSILQTHGEALIKLGSGEVWALHLGDRITLDNEFVEFEDNQRNVHTIFFDQVEKIYTHVAHME